MPSDDTRIAGTKTVADWKRTKLLLENGNNKSNWDNAYNDFLLKRLHTRYFAPIKAIEDMKSSVGEGFAIVTLHCSLIEFLAALVKGENFQDKKKSELAEHEYGRSESKNLFCEFLTSHNPFSCMFTEEQAKDFYGNVRCGLLHEAQTRGGWKIQVCSTASVAVDARGKIVYRNKLQPAFDQFLEWYKCELAKDPKLQKAFIRKFDGLSNQ